MTAVTMNHQCGIDSSLFLCVSEAAHMSGNMQSRMVGMFSMCIYWHIFEYFTNCLSPFGYYIALPSAVNPMKLAPPTENLWPQHTTQSLQLAGHSLYNHQLYGYVRSAWAYTLCPTLQHCLRGGAISQVCGSVEHFIGTCEHIYVWYYSTILLEHIECSEVF